MEHTAVKRAARAQWPSIRHRETILVPRVLFSFGHVVRENGKALKASGSGDENVGKLK